MESEAMAMGVSQENEAHVAKINREIAEMVATGEYDYARLGQLIAEGKAFRPVEENAVSVEQGEADAVSEADGDRAEAIRREIAGMVATGEYDYVKLEKLTRELQSLPEEEMV